LVRLCDRRSNEWLARRKNITVCPRPCGKRLERLIRFLHSSDYDLTAFEAARLPAHDDGSRASEIYTFTFRCVSAPVHISSVCRTIHAALTGPMVRASDRVKEELLDKAWTGLDKCWTELDGLRSEDTGEVLEQEDLDRFVDGWQVCTEATTLRPYAESSFSDFYIRVR
jgi:hypothetical protein